MNFRKKNLRANARGFLDRCKQQWDFIKNTVFELNFALASEFFIFIHLVLTSCKISEGHRIGDYVA